LAGLSGTATIKSDAITTVNLSDTLTAQSVVISNSGALNANSGAINFNVSNAGIADATRVTLDASTATTVNIGSLAASSYGKVATGTTDSVTTNSGSKSFITLTTPKATTVNMSNSLSVDVGTVTSIGKVGVVNGSTATGAITASSTGGIKLLTATQLADTANTTSKTGAQTLSMAAAAYAGVFYATTTSTTGGTITISNGGNTTTLNVKGVSTKGYKMVLSGPTLASKGVIYSFTAVVTDMFGNPTTGLLAANFVSTGLGAFAATPTETVTESTTKGTYTIKLAAADAAATGSGLLSVVLTTLVYTEVEASFGSLVDTATLSVNSADPTVSIAALQAQLASLTADYNALATKYNKLVKKSKRVAKK